MLPRLCRIALPPIILAAALVLYRMVFTLAASPDVAAAPARNEPWLVMSTSREPRICSDEQLAAVLQRVVPPVDGLTTNTIVHALRLWGPSAEFGDPAIPSGRMMKNYLLDDRVFQSLVGDQPPLFYRSHDGLDVRSYDDSPHHRPTSSYHSDDILATLAESGVALEATIRLRDGEARVAELLQGARQRFYLDRHEYEWSIIAFVRYGHPLSPWRNKFGERIDIESLVLELTDKPPEIGPCDGLHRLEALAVLYQLDRQSPALSARVKQRLLAYMMHVSNRLVKAQSVDGYWASGWSKLDSNSQGSQSGVVPTLHDKLLVTGHHLEWLALAPEEVQPPRETIVRAGQWLTHALLELDARRLHEAYGPYTHAARALCLWKGVEPMEAWRPPAASQRSAAARVPSPEPARLTSDL